MITYSPIYLHTTVHQWLTVHVKHYLLRDWTRAGAADLDLNEALLSVRHQPDTCLSCVGARGTSAKCQVGDVPSISRCNGEQHPSRLTWAYQTLVALDVDRGSESDMLDGVGVGGAKTDEGRARGGASAGARGGAAGVGGATVPSCIPGLNMRGDDVSDTPKGGFHGYDKPGCQDACQSRTDCVAYVFLREGCEHSQDTCYLKATLEGNGVTSCACFAAKPFTKLPAMCATMAVPSSGNDRSLLPAGLSCTTLTKEDCCHR
jgi:hypothetical protein